MLVWCVESRGVHTCNLESGVHDWETTLWLATGVGNPECVDWHSLENSVKCDKFTLSRDLSEEDNDSSNGLPLPLRVPGIKPRADRCLAAS